MPSLEEFGLVTSLVPSCKWTFPQEYEGGTHLVESPDGTPTGLVKALVDFRIKAHLPIGNPEREIAESIKQRSPMNARFKGNHRTVAERKPEPKGTPLIQRILAQTKALIDLKPKLLSVDDADQRAEVCIACRQNVQWRTKCAPCNAEVEYQGLILRQLTGYAHDDLLQGCRLHNLHLPSAVFVDRDSMPERHADAPEHCWIGKTPQL